MPSFLDLYTIADRSGTGVILTRTREPGRAVEELIGHFFASAESTDSILKTWNCVSGWTEIQPVKDAASAAPQGDANNELASALAKIYDHPEHKAPWKTGMYIMVYPHWGWSDPQVIQTLKEYARLFTAEYRRLILIVPNGATLPPELEDDIPIIDFDLPTKEALRASASALLDGQFEEKGATSFTSAQMEQLASATQGMTLAEADRAVSGAIVVTTEDSTPLSPKVFPQFLQVVMAAKTEVVKRSEVLEIVPTEVISNVGGNDLLKAWLDVRKHSFGDKARKFGLRTTKGLLAVGPPGTGKSLLAKAMASVFGFPLVKFNFDRCFGSLVGESESRIRRALDQARAMAPIVLWMDEVDSAGLSANSSSNDSGVNDRVMATMLSFMNDCQEPIVWAMTANRPWKINPALLRAGRLDGVFYISLPDDATRAEILRIHLEKRGHSFSKIGGAPDTVAFSEGFSGAELELVVEEALLHAFANDLPVSDEVLLEQARLVKPLSQSSPEDFARMVEWGQKNAKPASSPPGQAKPASPPKGRLITAGSKKPLPPPPVLAKKSPLIRNR